MGGSWRRGGVRGRGLERGAKSQYSIYQLRSFTSVENCQNWLTWVRLSFLQSIDSFSRMEERERVCVCVFVCVCARADVPACFRVCECECVCGGGVFLISRQDK